MATYSRSSVDQSSLHRFSGLYAGLALAEVISHFLLESAPWFHYLTKPALMLALLIYYQVQVQGQRDARSWGVSLALLCSWLGDIFLMFEDRKYFLWGLGAFLLAHLAYLWVFIRHSPAPQQRSLLRQSPWLIVPFILIGFGLMALLGPGLGDFWWPVVIYASVISLMALAALNRWQRVPVRSFSWVFMGALLFMLSDSLIALDQFGQDRFELPFSQTWIMLTYLAAQYLIVMGLLQERWLSRS